MANTNPSGLQAVGPNERLVSLNPSDYSYPVPTAQQQQQMYQQFVQMAFFCFSQMQMQNAMQGAAAGQFPFPFPGFCGMPPVPGFFPMCPPPGYGVPTPAVQATAQEAPKTQPTLPQVTVPVQAAAAPAQAPQSSDCKPAACIAASAPTSDPLMDCVMDLSMEDIQKLFEESDEPSAATAMQVAVGSPDCATSLHPSSPCASLGSERTSAATAPTAAAAPAAASPAAAAASRPGSASALAPAAQAAAPQRLGSPQQQQQAGECSQAQQPDSLLVLSSNGSSGSSFADLDLDQLISLPNCAMAEGCKLDGLDSGACLFSELAPSGAPRGGPASAPAAPKRLRIPAAGGGVRKQSARLREKGLAGIAAQEALEAVGGYLDSEEPADWEAMLFPALDSEPCELLSYA